MTPLVVSYRMSREEWLEALREHLYWRSPRRVWVFGCFVIPVAVTVASAARGDDLRSFLGISISGIIVAGVALPIVLLWRRWSLGTRRPVRGVDRMDPARREIEQTFRFSEDGLESRSVFEESKAEWKVWASWREGASFFHVYPTASLDVFIPIPKRAADVAALRGLFGRKLKQLR